jgi:hypothetical protein
MGAPEPALSEVEGSGPSDPGNLKLKAHNV